MRFKNSLLGNIGNVKLDIDGWKFKVEGCDFDSYYVCFNIEVDGWKFKVEGCDFDSYYVCFNIEVDGWKLIVDG